MWLTTEQRTLYKTTMSLFSITYRTYFRLSSANEYEFTKCGKCFNSKTGRQIKKVCSTSGCIGYNINGRFQSLSSLRPRLECIPQKQKTPF